MGSAWIGVTACLGVIYYGVVQASSHPWLLLNPQALILVLGGTIAIGFLTYSPLRLYQVFEFVLMGFLFRAKKREVSIAHDMIAFVALHFRSLKNVYVSARPYAFLEDAFRLLAESEISAVDLHERLMAQRNAIRRRYDEDARILNNLAKYPFQFGVLSVAVGLIERAPAVGVGEAGIGVIGQAIATSLVGLVWAVGLNNFVLLPLADNATKAADDEVYLRDWIISVVDKIKKGGQSKRRPIFVLIG